VSAPPASPPGQSNQILRTVDGTSTNTIWTFLFLTDLADVNAAESIVNDGKALAWDNASGFWIPKALFSPIITFPSVNGGDQLIYTGSAWINRPGIKALGSIASNIIVGSNPGGKTTIAIPAANLQIANGGFGYPGETLTVVLTTSGTSSFNITPAANVVMNGTLATGTVSGKIWTITFVQNDAGTLIETARTGPM
jgi:hypothetical protein